MRKQLDDMKLDHSDIASAYVFAVDPVLLGVVKTNVQLFLFSLILVIFQVSLPADLLILLFACEKF